MHCDPGPGSLTGKLVIDGPCGNYVVEVISGNFDSSEVDSHWTDPSTGTAYTNVFTVTDACTFGGYNISQGQSFTFQFTPADSTVVQNCEECLIAVPTPPVRSSVEDIMALP
jgi:hypothetical protein